MTSNVTAKLAGDIAEIRVSLQHPSEDGQRQDPKSNKFVPADFVQQLRIKANGRLLVEANLGGGLSYNPVFLFKVKGLKAGATILAEWTTSKDVIGSDGRRDVKEDNGQVDTVLK